MTTPGLIEEAAIAMWESTERLRWDRDALDCDKAAYRREARAALAVVIGRLREPSQEMLDVVEGHVYPENILRALASHLEAEGK